GVQLWKSNGTVTGTTLVTNSNGGIANFGVYPADLANVNGTLYFVGYGLGKGYQVFKSDGTAAGTAPVTSIAAAAGGCNPSELTASGGTLYFQANDGVHGYQLWDLNTSTGATTMLT